MRTLRGLATAFGVGGSFGVFMAVMLGATWQFSVAASALIGLAIAAVILSQTSEADLAADAAWTAAAPDLPPASDRRSLEQNVLEVPGRVAPPGARAGRRAKQGAAR
jgi:hypothetical protein